MGTGAKNTYGPRRRFKGKRGVGRIVRGRTVVSMRSQTGATKPTAAGFEMNQTEAFPTKNLPGKFKVIMPRNRIRYVDPNGRAT
jgi:hypothetical protein